MALIVVFDLVKLLTLSLWFGQALLLARLAIKTSILNFGVLGLASALMGQLNLIYLDFQGYVPENKALTYMSAGFFATLIFVTICKPIRAPSPVILKSRKDQLQRISVSIQPLFYLYVLFHLYINYITNFDFGWGGARVIAAKQNLVVTNSQYLLEGVAVFYCFSQLAIKRYIPLIILLFCGFTSGSKGGAVVFLCEIFFFHFLLFGYYPIKITKIVALILLILPLQFFYLNEDFELFVDPLKYLAYRGDVFNYLFVDGYWYLMSSIYEPISLIFHHFLRLFGSRGYDAPFGSVLFALKQGVPFDEVAGGATAPTFLYFDLAFGCSVLETILYSGVLGLLGALLYNKGVNILYETITVPNIIFGFWFTQSWIISSDWGVFSYRMTPVFVLYFVYKIFFLFMTVNHPFNVKGKV